jgi:hypothetical protein
LNRDRFAKQAAQIAHFDYLEYPGVLHARNPGFSPHHGKGTLLRRSWVSADQSEGAAEHKRLTMINQATSRDPNTALKTDY